jgi:GTPase SAR1 family protein
MIDRPIAKRDRAQIADRSRTCPRSNITTLELVKARPIAGAPAIIKSKEKLKPVFWYDAKGKQRLSVLIVGPSGSGKSTLASKIVDDLADDTMLQVFIISVNQGEEVINKKRPVRYTEKRPVYTMVNGEEKLVVEFDSFGELVPVMQDAEVRDHQYATVLDWRDPAVRELPFEWYHDSIVVFDDVEDLGDADANKWVNYLQNMFLTAGRKLNIHMVSTQHNFKDGRATVRNETAYWVFPVAGAAQYKLVGALTELMGLTKKRAAGIIDTLGDTRHAVVHTHMPAYILGDHCAILL